MELLIKTVKHDELNFQLLPFFNFFVEYFSVYKISYGILQNIGNDRRQYIL